MVDLPFLDLKVDESNRFFDLIPDAKDRHPESRFEDLIPLKKAEKTEIPKGVFDLKESLTDKKAYIGISGYEEDYEDITEDLSTFDKLFFQTLLGNEKVFRQKKTDSKFRENFIHALKSRNIGWILGSLGGWEVVHRLALQTIKSPLYKKSPAGIIAGVLAGALGGTGGQQIYDRVKEVITGEEETIEEIWAKIPKDFKTNLNFEMFGTFLGVAPYYLKKWISPLEPGAKKVWEMAKRAGVEVIPAEFSKSGIADMFIKVGGVFPFVSGPFVKFMKNRAIKSNKQLEDYFWAFGPTQKETSGIAEKLMKLSSETYAGWRQFVGKQYKSFENLTKGLSADGTKVIAKFDHNIIPLKNLAYAESKAGAQPYLMDVVENIIKSSNTNNSLKEGLKITSGPNFTEALQVAQLFYKDYSKKKAISAETFMNFIRNTIKKGEKKSWAGAEGGGSIHHLKDMKTAAESSLDGMNLTGVPKDIAEMIKAQYKIAKNSFKIGIVKDGKLIQEGTDLFHRKAASTIERAKKNLLDVRLTQEGTKYYDQIVKDILSMGSKEGVKDLYKLIGKNDELFGAFIRKYMDDALSATSKSKPGSSAAGLGTFNWLNFNPQELIKKLGIRDYVSHAKGATIPEKEEAFREMLNIFSKSKYGKSVNAPNANKLIDFLYTLEKHGNIWVPDTSTFLRRGAVLGGLSVFLGLHIFGYGEQGAKYGLLPILGMRSFMKMLSNPKNTRILFETLDSRIPDAMRWSNAIKLLDVTKGYLSEEAKDASGEKRKNILEYLNLVNEYQDWAEKNPPKKGESLDQKDKFFKEMIESGAFDKPVYEDVDELEERVYIDEPVDRPIESAQLNVPRVNQEFDTASVVPPMADPAQAAGSGDINPEIIEQMASLGMPLFGNEGGIASLMKHKKPQQMVA